MLRCFVLLALLATGCGRGGPELATVSGRITIDGKPVPEGTVQFWPQAGRPASGEIDADGRYRLTTYHPGDGALLGQHVVTVEANRLVGSAPEINSLEQEREYFSDRTAAPVRAQRTLWIVPERYSQQHASGLTAQVEPGENTIDFALTTQRKGS